MPAFPTLTASSVAQGYPISANGTSASSRVASQPLEVQGTARYSQVPVSSASQVQSALMRQYSVGASTETSPMQYSVAPVLETTPIRKAVNVSQYSPRQASRQSQPMILLSSVPDKRSVQVPVTPPHSAVVATSSSPRAPAVREINTDFEVLRLRQQMMEMDALVEELRQEIVSLRTRQFVVEDRSQQSNNTDAEVVHEKAAVIEELRHEIGDQRQERPRLRSASPPRQHAIKELAELQRLRQIIEDQGVEIQELRAKTVELMATNAELESQKAELEQAFSGPQVYEAAETDACFNGQASQVMMDAEQIVEIVETVEEVNAEDAPLAMEKVRTPPTPSRKMRPLRGDAIDMFLQDYLDKRPDFNLMIDKVKTGWYIFGEPISKKLYLKMSGEHVVCRIGGGTTDLVKYLDDFRLCVQDKKDQEVARARVKRLSSREYGVNGGAVARMPSI